MKPRNSRQQKREDANIVDILKRIFCSHVVFKHDAFETANKI